MIFVSILDSVEYNLYKIAKTYIKILVKLRHHNTNKCQMLHKTHVGESHTSKNGCAQNQIYQITQLRDSEDTIQSQDTSNINIWLGKIGPYLTKKNLSTLEREKADYIKKALGVLKTTHYRLVYILAGKLSSQKTSGQN